MAVHEQLDPPIAELEARIEWARQELWKNHEDELKRRYMAAHIWLRGMLDERTRAVDWVMGEWEGKWGTWGEYIEEGGMNGRREILVTIRSMD